MLKQAKNSNQAISAETLCALSRAAHEANRLAKRLDDSAGDSLYAVKDKILEAFVLMGAAKVNNLSLKNDVGLSILCDRSQLHMPLRCFSREGRAEVLRQARGTRIVAPLRDCLPSDQLQTLIEYFPRANKAA
jgi:hypothetical protein